MGKRTSVYLTDAQAAALTALDLTLAEIVRKGFAAAEHELFGPPVARRSPVVGRAIEHSIEDPFTGEVTVRAELNPSLLCPHAYPDVRMIAGVRVCKKCPAP